MNKATKQAINWDVVDGTNSEFEDIYPIAQWWQGSPQQEKGIMKTGGIFIPSNNYPAEISGEFDSSKLVFRDGTTAEGWASDNFHASIIRTKLVWKKDNAEKNIPYFYALVKFKDNDDIFQLNFRGVTKALDMQAAFKIHRSRNVALANRSRPQGRNPLEPYALYMNVIPSPIIDAQAKNSDESSKVTPPKLAEPKDTNLEYVRSLWIGTENYQICSQTFQETKGWQDKIGAFKDDSTENIPNPNLRVSEQTLLSLKQLLDAKDLDEREIAEEVTYGESDNLGTLTEQEAQDCMEKYRNL